MMTLKKIKTAAAGAVIGSWLAEEMVFIDQGG